MFYVKEIIDNINSQNQPLLVYLTFCAGRYVHKKQEVIKFKTHTDSTDRASSMAKCPVFDYN